MKISRDLESLSSHKFRGALGFLALAYGLCQHTQHRAEELLGLSCVESGQCLAHSGQRLVVCTGSIVAHHQKKLDHKFQMTALVSFSLSLRDGIPIAQDHQDHGHVDYDMSSSVPGTSRSVSSLPRCVETAVRLQGPGLALRPAQQFRGAPLVSCVGL